LTIYVVFLDGNKYQFFYPS